MMDVDPEFLKLFDNATALNLGDKACPEATPIAERDIVAAGYREQSSYSVIYRDHHAEYGDFIRNETNNDLNTYLLGCAVSDVKYTPTFLIKSLTNKGLVLCHLRHEQISHDCAFVDVLVIPRAETKNVYRSTTVYLIFATESDLDEDDIMDTKLRLVNHVFDIRSVGIQEQVRGQTYVSKKRENKKKETQ